jgi:nitrogen fixation/metabolism regulation signal transduction histidine kinase
MAKKLITIEIETDEDLIEQAFENILYWAKSALHENNSEMQYQKIKFRANGDHENSEMCDHVIELNDSRISLIDKFEEALRKDKFKVEGI